MHKTLISPSGVSKGFQANPTSRADGPQQGLCASWVKRASTPVVLPVAIKLKVFTAAGRETGAADVGGERASTSAPTTPRRRPTPRSQQQGPPTRPSGPGRATSDLVRDPTQHRTEAQVSTAISDALPRSSKSVV